MSNLYAASKYKNDIINLLYKSDNFIKLIDPVPSECPNLDIEDVLSGGTWIIDGKEWKEQGYVFDYNFVSETTTDKKTFVFVETDIDTIRDNIFTDFNLYVCVFTDKDLIRLNRSTTPTTKEVKQMGYFASSTHGNRIDILCDCIDRILQGSSRIAGVGDIQPAPRNHMTIYTPNSKYYGKCLKYNITNYNPGGDECGD